MANISANSIIVHLRMIQAIQLATRCTELFLNGKWIANTNYKEQLARFNYKEATQKIGTLNSIAELTYHINYYVAGIVAVLEGGELTIKDKYSFDMPLIQNENDWQKLCSTFIENAEKFINLVTQMNDEVFFGAFVDAQYGTYQRNLEGLVEHSYYHLGQIVLLGKMIKV